MGQRGGVVLGQAVVGHKARRHGARQLGHRGLDALHPLIGNHQRRQVGVGEVAVIGRVFLGAHGARLAGVGVEQHGGLLDGVAVFDLLNLPAHFKVDGLLHELEAVQVLDFAARAQRRTGAAHRDIGVAAEAAFLHVAVADADPGDDLVQLLGVGHGLVAGADVGLGDDFEQRRARAVQVDARLTNEVFVQGLASVFFEVSAHQTHGFLFVAQEEFNLAPHHHGNFKLADLVALGQIGVKIIFPRKNAFG